MAPTDALSDVSEWRVVATGAIVMGGEIWCTRGTENPVYVALRYEKDGREIVRVKMDEIDTNYCSACNVVIY